MASWGKEELGELGYETLYTDHPAKSLTVRDTEYMFYLVDYLHENGILATGLG